MYLNKILEQNTCEGYAQGWIQTDSNNKCVCDWNSLNCMTQKGPILRVRDATLFVWHKKDQIFFYQNIRHFLHHKIHKNFYLRYY